MKRRKDTSKGEQNSLSIKRFETELAILGYSDNSKRMYIWQAKRFEKELRKKFDADDRPVNIFLKKLQSKPEVTKKIAEQYLRSVRSKKSRTYFLQACSTVMHYINLHTKKTLLNNKSLRSIQKVG